MKALDASKIALIWIIIAGGIALYGIAGLIPGMQARDARIEAIEQAVNPEVFGDSDIAEAQTITIHLGEKELQICTTPNYEEYYAYGTGWDIYYDMINVGSLI